MALTAKSWVLLSLAILAGISLASTQATAQGASGIPSVIVNNVQLSAAQIMALERMYGVPVQHGRYWYDPVTGVWGFEGGPAVAQINPGLSLGGPLRANASHGNTGVFINGRELHILEVRALQSCTQVIRGRYWMNAAGIGGVEGGPPIFNLAALCGGPRIASRGGTQTEVFGNGAAWSGNWRTGGGVTTDGQGGATVFLPGGGMVMTPN